MAAKTLLTPPKHAPGDKVAVSLMSGLYRMKSEAVNYNSTSPLSVFVAPINTLILGMIVHISTAWDGAIPSLILGASGATNRHVDAADVDIKTAGFYPVWRPFEYTAITSIIATLVASTATQGKAYIWALYAPLSNETR